MHEDRVSVIIPCRNEEKYIGKVLDDLVAQDYSRDKLSVLVVDGMSNDGTRAIIADYVKKYDWIKLLDNPDKTAPYALNRGIKNSSGYVLRMDAHASYPHNYISKLLAWMNKIKADNVGCSVLTVPGDTSKKSLSIARVLAHPFGVGNAHFRLGVDKPKEVDTVMFGFYKRDVFEKIGYFDEELTRNQDDEFNARLKRAGGKIFLIPGLNFRYFARTSFKKLWQMYYQYGYFKPLVNRKIGIPSNLRQIVPSIFIATLIITSFAGLLNPAFFTFFILTAGSWISLNLFFSIKLAFKDTFVNIFYNFTGFATLHFAYGLGYLKGIIDFIIFSRKKDKKHRQISLSR